MRDVQPTRQAPKCDFPNVTKLIFLDHRISQSFAIIVNTMIMLMK